MPKSRGFTVPIVLIISTIFISLPVLFLFLTTRQHDGSVKGISDIETQKRNGIAIQIESTQGNWDLYEYKCNTKEECTSGLFNGVKVYMISGGKSSAQVIHVDKPIDLGDAKYIKMFVRPAWGSSTRSFKTTVKPDLEIVETNISFDKSVYSVIIFPTSVFDSTVNYYDAVVFSDE
jgi:hypothetical protein